MPNLPRSPALGRFILVLVFALVASVPLAPATPVHAAQPASEQARPQTGLRVEALEIATPRGTRRFRVEIADTAATREIGMTSTPPSRLPSGCATR
jgi:hypothetical protein